ncbi:zinc ribbon domain-containing protein [candidate division GN15 bacterium]|nr:zinc ribbon domain-containing protein [candidate division GN15 bacterium]
MPIFEYKCNDCDETFEELVSSKDSAVPCPKCGSSNTHKLLSVFAASGGSWSAAPSCGGGGCGSGFT